MAASSVENGGLSSPGGIGRAAPPPDGHTKMCWAGAIGLARRGRPPEDFEVSHERARQLLADDPAVCRCVPENKRPRRRR